jgi:hypothetical protein
VKFPFPLRPECTEQYAQKVLDRDLYLDKLNKNHLTGNQVYRLGYGSFCRLFLLSFHSVVRSPRI